jgi:anaphase-promoting complex subunit 2
MKTKTVEEKALLVVAKEDAATAVDFTIVSHHFWPPLQEEELQLHPRMAARFEKYGESFSVLKNPRKLDFKQQLGSVHLELDFDNGVSRAFTVAPVHATLIMHFEDEEGWEQQELARLTGLAPEVVAKKMMFWANQGVVQVTNNGGGAGGGNNVTYTLLKNQDAEGPAGRGLGTSGPTNLEEDELEAAVSSDAQEAQELGVYISYILGMLGTYGGRPVRAIHDTLKIWAGDQNYTMKLPELERILGRLVLEEKIECVDGAYQLPNRPAGNHHR